MLRITDVGVLMDFVTLWYTNSLRTGKSSFSIAMLNYQRVYTKNSRCTTQMGSNNGYDGDRIGDIMEYNEIYHQPYY